MKDRKCRKCGEVVTENELVMLMALMAAELDEIIEQGVEATGLDKAEVADQLIMPLLRETTVCIRCFEEVNARIPVKEFLGSGAGDPSFTWERVRLAVLDA